VWESRARDWRRRCGLWWWVCWRIELEIGGDVVDCGGGCVGEYSSGLEEKVWIVMSVWESRDRDWRRRCGLWWWVCGRVELGIGGEGVDCCGCV
jgi:hypothetical protein